MKQNCTLAYVIQYCKFCNLIGALCFEKKLGHNPDPLQQGNNIHDSTQRIQSGCESSQTHKC